MLWLFLSLLLSCSDPAVPNPVPDPEGIPRWSTSIHIHWSNPADPPTRPLAIFIGDPGGPIDQIVTNSDVTTFLNDRFDPWFIIPDMVQGIDAETALFLDLDGCSLGSAISPVGPSQWIGYANLALETLHEGSHDGPLSPSPVWNIAIPSTHPIHGTCTR